MTTGYDPVGAALEAAVDRIAWSERLGDYVTIRSLLTELNAYIAGPGEKRVARLAGKRDVDGLIALLYGVARQYAEVVRAEAFGYDFSDIAWYDTGKVLGLLPLALNPEWDGLSGEGDETAGRSGGLSSEGGGLMCSVMDVRAALGEWAGYGVGDFDPGTDLGLERLGHLVERLGGFFPGAPGYVRRNGK